MHGRLIRLPVKIFANKLTANKFNGTGLNIINFIIVEKTFLIANFSN